MWRVYLIGAAVALLALGASHLYAYEHGRSYQAGIDNVAGLEDTIKAKDAAIAERDRQAQARTDVEAAARAREEEATRRATATRKQFDDYVLEQETKQPAAAVVAGDPPPSCDWTDDDRLRLRALIGHPAGRRSDAAPGPAFDLRSAGRNPSAEKIPEGRLRSGRSSVEGGKLSPRT